MITSPKDAGKSSEFLLLPRIWLVSISVKYVHITTNHSMIPMTLMTSCGTRADVSTLRARATAWPRVNQSVLNRSNYEINTLDKNSFIDVAYLEQKQNVFLYFSPIFGQNREKNHKHSRQMIRQNKDSEFFYKTDTGYVEFNKNYVIRAKILRKLFALQNFSL